MKKNLKYLAVLGNGIPTSGGKIGDYILNYVFSMFEAPSITNTLTQTLTVNTLNIDGTLQLRSLVLFKLS
ncbi:unnamed protein product [Auanema sp. JU1783]|nr:unnamed protein product [Auanema sp. JU1783]